MKILFDTKYTNYEHCGLVYRAYVLAPSVDATYELT